MDYMGLQERLWIEVNLHMKRTEKTNFLNNATMTSRDAKQFEGIYEELLYLRSRGVFIGKKIAIVGAWNTIGIISEMLNGIDLILTHIADNNPSKQGVSIEGIISQSVDSLANEKNLIILIYNTKYWREFHDQLVKLSFVNNVDFFVLFGEKERKKARLISNALTLPNSDWIEVKSQAKKAWAAYVETQKEYGEKPIWLMHIPSLGDLYMFSLFLPHAMSVRRISECACVLVVTSKSTARLADALGFRHIKLITVDEAYTGWLVLMCIMGEHLNIRNAAFYGEEYIFHSLTYNSNDSIVNFRDAFEKYVFGFYAGVAPIYPVFPKNDEPILAQFNKYGLKPGETVLISPYARHFEPNIKKSDWETLVSDLKSKGYTVCTNCGTSEELPLSGTTAIFIELQDCVRFVEIAGHFIGVRSGLCELICTAEAQKVVIYETGTQTARIDFFSFEKMGIGKGHFLEVVNDGINTSILFNSIADIFQETTSQRNGEENNGK